MGDDEVEHQNWTHNRIGVHLRARVSKWEFTARRTILGIDIVFLHYALAEDGISFQSIVRDAATEVLDQQFAAYVDAETVFFGHTHHSVTYDDTLLMSAFDEYQVPEREFLRRIFFGGK